ncbi:MAG: class I SAM-dependent methyltransferase [Xanthomonadales bacterium]|jgi:O-methyltransferase involved in polyketide biosynthesis|nr:class I SAM-dependent methyltransferase [Xanthomonadales bacterium]
MIAGRASATALLVALSVWRMGAEHGLPETSIRLAGEALHAAGGGWRALRWLARFAAGRWLLDRVEALLLPGLARHHVRRKRWLWRRLRCAPPAARLLWLGVGFDGLARAHRARSPGTPVIEFDHPDSLALRQRLPLIAGATANTPPALPLALPEDSATLIELCQQAPSTLIAEGLLMYLSPRSLLRLLRALSRLPLPPALWFSALEPTVGGGHGFARVHAPTRRWLRRQGEPFRWRLGRERLQALLRRHGYRVEAVWDGAGFGEYVLCAGAGAAANATAAATAAARRLPRASADG